MHDLKTNFDKILPIVNESLADQLNSDQNLQFYPNAPDMPDAHIISLALLQEALGIDSENWFWSKLRADYPADFRALPHLTCYNRRRKRLAGWIEKVASQWSQHIRPCGDTYIVDSIPIPVVHIAREYSTGVCREQFHSAPGQRLQRDYRTVLYRVQTTLGRESGWSLSLHGNDSGQCP